MPLWLAALVLGVGTRARPADEPRRESFALAPVAWMALIPFAALLIVVQPGGGWGRDWDVATGMGAVTALVTTYVFVARWRGAEGNPLAPVTTVALAVAVALWGGHASEAIGLERVESLLHARPLLPVATRAQAYDFLGVHALNAGKSGAAVGYFERSIECAPNPRLFHQLGLALLANGETDRARVEFLRSIELNPAVCRSLDRPGPLSGCPRITLEFRVAAVARSYSSTADRCGDSEY